jgi:ElaB/YqjD/DUF883 family membrane-anchored ribosome-binding protein
MKSIRAGTSSYEDEARSATAQALEKAGERVRDLRFGVKDLANKSVNSMGEYANATTRYVSEQPRKSALIAAAVGAAVAALVLAMRRNSDGRFY